MKSTVVKKLLPSSPKRTLGKGLKKSRPKSVASLKKLADKYFSIYIRLRDSDRNGNVKCITCPTVKPWQAMQNGHFVKRSVSLLRYDDENCNAQCPACNIWKYGELFTYGKELDLKYGAGTADKLHAQRFTTHKFSAQELQDIIDEAKSNISHANH